MKLFLAAVLLGESTDMECIRVHAKSFYHAADMLRQEGIAVLGLNYVQDIEPNETPIPQDQLA